MLKARQILLLYPLHDLHTNFPSVSARAVSGLVTLSMRAQIYNKLPLRVTFLSSVELYSKSSAIGVHEQQSSRIRQHTKAALWL